MIGKPETSVHEGSLHHHRITYSLVTGTRVVGFPVDIQCASRNCVIVIKDGKEGKLQPEARCTGAGTAVRGYTGVGRGSVPWLSGAGCLRQMPTGDHETDLGNTQNLRLHPHRVIDNT